MTTLCRLSLLLLLVLQGLVDVVDCFMSGASLLKNQRATRQAPFSSSSSSALCTLPKLIVFDLDNTLWTPELYQLRTHQRKKQTPVAGKDVKLFKGAQAALEAKQRHKVQYAIASRTKSVQWAHDLLCQFDIMHLFDYVEIFPGNKRTHFHNIQQKSGIAFHDMMFFDDARDGRYGNCEPVSQMGVLSVHCPDGLHSPDVFDMGLHRYKQWNKLPNTIVESNGHMTTSGVRQPMNNNIASSMSSMSTSKTTVMKPNQQQPRQRRKGIVKMVNVEKGYGFVQCCSSTNDDDNNMDGATTTRNDDVSFHFSSLPDNDILTVKRGDELSFTIERNIKNGKYRATSIEMVSTTNKQQQTVTCNTTTTNTIRMPVFSMNMPFAALLANGYKTLETRNNSMFVPYPEGTQMLLHVGRRTYPDGNRHVDVLKSGGLTLDEIQDAKLLPDGNERGMIVAIVEIGPTYETTIEERSNPTFQQQVAAFGKDSGRMVTEIKRVEYLKRPVVRVTGQPGVFHVDVDVNVLPDGWTTIASPSFIPSDDKEQVVVESSSSDKTSTTKTTTTTTSTTKNKKPMYSISG